MNKRILKICECLAHRFLSSIETRDDITIFLCGGTSKEEATFRSSLGKHLMSLKLKYRYSVYFPENMFFEMILGHKKYDLLSLENLLANSVNCIGRN